MPAEIEAAFPNLTRSGYQITAPATSDYNCITWATGATSPRWGYQNPGDYWPPGIPRNQRVETIMLIFANQGYEICDNDAQEPGYQKIAIYAFAGQFTHVARQLPNGQWTSKLGSREVITHPTPAALTNGIYGQIQAIMRRPTPTP